MFWQHLTDKYWDQMSDPQRTHIWNWLQKNPYYEESLKTEEETQIFHARFDPDNQYMVHTNFHGVEDKRRAFKMGDRYYITRTTSIADEYIVEVTKFTPKVEY